MNSGENLTALDIEGVPDIILRPFFSCNGPHKGRDPVADINCGN